jgi:hypothetical protein
VNHATLHQRATHDKQKQPSLKGKDLYFWLRKTRRAQRLGILCFPLPCARSRHGLCTWQGRENVSLLPSLHNKLANVGLLVIQIVCCCKEFDKSMGQNPPVMLVHLFYLPVSHAEASSQYCLNHPVRVFKILFCRFGAKSVELSVSLCAHSLDRFNRLWSQGIINNVFSTMMERDMLHVQSRAVAFAY